MPKKNAQGAQPNSSSCNTLARKKYAIEEFEPRVLFSADAQLMLPENKAPLQHEVLVDSQLEAISLVDEQKHPLASLVRAQNDITDQQSNELVFIDANTPEIDLLIRDIELQGNKSVFVLDPNTDGVQQISDALSRFQNIDAIHLISHGDNGNINLGATTLNNSNFEHYQSAINDWAQSLSDDADILIYGCNVAQGFEGKQLISNLAQTSGADVAASTDATGAALLAGDWELEFQQGVINSNIAISETAQRNYSAILPNDIPIISGPVGFKDVAITTARPGAHDVYEGDIDSDGDLDFAAVANTDGSLTWYRNNGNASFTEHVITNSLPGLISVQLIDIDSDGDMDMVTTASTSNSVDWWENDGSENFSRHNIATGIAGAFSVHVEDIDGDNDLDMVVSQNYQSLVTDPGHIWWFENNGSQSFTQHLVASSTSTTPVNNIETTRIADVDGDGDMDILAAMNGDHEFVWYENDGSENFSKHVIASGVSARYAIDIKAVDLDGDGDQDIIAANWGNSGVGNIHYFENDGSENFTQHIVDNDFREGQTIHIEDLDQDGDLDIIGTASGQDLVAWYENDGSENFDRRVLSMGEDGAESAVTGDFNGDGHIDIISASRNDGTYRLFQNLQQRIANTNTLLFNTAGNTISISDSDTTNVTVSLSVAHGAMQFGTTSGLSLLGGSYAGNNVQFSGTLGDVNAALATLGYVPSSSYAGQDKLNIEVVDDPTGGPANQATAQVFIDVVDANVVVVDTRHDTLDGDTSSIAALLADRGSDGRISLREALLATNNTNNGSNVDEIRFAMPPDEASPVSGNPHWSIFPGSALPTITEGLLIDGLTQDPSNPNDVRISINGGSAGSGANGLTVNSNDVTIRGLNIKVFNGAGIVVNSGNNVVISNNFIGTHPNGMSSLANTVGILLQGTASGVSINNNVISGNSQYGIHIDGTSNHSITTNRIGTDRLGTGVVANGVNGIRLDNSHNNTIGGAGAANIISGNSGAGIKLAGTSSLNTISANRIGTDNSGTVDLGNGGAGIELTGSSSNNTIGGDRLNGEENLISGNTGSGILLKSGTDNNTIIGNLIGVNSSTNAALSNLHGIEFETSANNNQIGGTSEAHSNIIAGNAGSGILMDGSFVVDNIVTYNYIGLAAVGNGAEGVRITNGASNNRIGGTNGQHKNFIINNTEQGVQVEGSSSTGNAILSNIIRLNGALGIDLGDDGVSVNDNLDSDAGPNGFQNSPELWFANVSGSTTSIRGELNAAANTTYRIELFETIPSDVDPTGRGETSNYLGFLAITTDASGQADINIDIGALGVGNRLTATATQDLSGGSYAGTSEFSQNVVITNNVPPVLSAGNSGDDYSEGGTDQPYSSTTVSDADSTDFDGGVLTYQISSGGDGFDRLFINPGGNVTLVGNDVRVGGISIGSFAGGTSSTALTMSLNNNATAARVQEVIQQLHIETTSDNPTSGTRFFQLTISDGDGATSNISAANSVFEATNDAPTLDTSGNMTLSTITEDDSNNNGNSVAEIIASAGGDRITDPDSPNEGIAIFNTNQPGSGNWQFSIDGGSTWSNIGSVASNNALLLGHNDRIRFVPDQQHAENVNIQFRAWDQSSGSAGTKVNIPSTGGDSAFSTADEVAVLNITGINDDPVVSNSGTSERYLLNTSLNLTNISITDVDDSTVTVTLTLSDVSAGVLSVGTSGAVTSTFNAATGVWSASGDTNEVNALLAVLSYTPANNYVDDFTISVNVDDGNGGVVNDSKAISFNAVPSIGGYTGSYTYNEDISIGLTPFSINDVDDTILTVTRTLSNLSAGILSTGTSGSTTSTYNAATGVWQAIGTATEINVLIAGTTFTPTANSSTSLSIQNNISDGSNITSFSQALVGVSSNDAPVLDTSGIFLLSSIDENDQSNIGNSVADIILSAGGDRITDIDGVLEGIAVTGQTHTSNSAGNWQYSIDGGSSWVDMSNYSNTSALLLRDTDRLRFLPDGHNGDIGAISFKAWDQSNGTAGTTANTIGTAFSIASDSADITVTSVNDTPIISMDNSTIQYGLDTSASLNTITVNDVDNVSTSLQLIISNPLAGSLNTATSGAVTSTYNAVTGVWEATGLISDVNTLAANLVFTPSSGFNSDFTLSVQANDGTGGNTVLQNWQFNAAPLATNNGTAETYTEDTPLNLTDMVLSDFDNGTLTVTLTFSDTSAGLLSTATSGSTSSTFNPATGIWTATGPIAELNDLLANLIYSPSNNYNSNFSISTNVSDGFNTVTNSKNFIATAVNDIPTATNLNTTEAYTEDTPLNLSNIVVNDVDNANTTVTLTLSDISAGALNTATAGSVTSSYNAATGIWSASGAIADVNTLLAGLTFTPAPNYNSNFNIATSVDDGAAPALTGSKAFTGTAVNDPPNISNISTPETYTEDTPLILSGLSISDDDHTSAIITITLSDINSGSFNTNTSNAVTSTFNAATGVWTASGNNSDLNILLASLVFTPASNYNNPFSLTITALDSVGSHSGIKPFTAIAVNDAPTATGINGSENYIEDTLLNFTNIIVNDTDNANLNITLTLSDINAGSLSTQTVGTATSNFNPSTGVWTASGTIADLNTLLANLNFTPAVNYTGSFNINSSINDGVNDTLGVINMTAITVNDAPVLDNSVTMTLSNINENAVDNNGNSIAEIIASASGNPITDVDNNLEGIAITAISASNGYWQFSDDGGSNWQSIDIVSDNNALLLRDIDRLRFVPDTENGETAALNFKAWDQSNGIAGTYSDTNGDNAFSTASGQTNISVAAINDAPESQIDSFSVDEGSHTRLDIAANDYDVDNAIDHGSIEIINGPSHGQIIVNSDGSVHYRHNDSETRQDSFSYTIRDISGAVSAVNNVTLAINAVNDNAPIVRGEHFTTTSVGAFDGNGISLLANDSDIDGDQMQVVLTESPEHGELSINPDGTFIYTPDPGYQGSDSFSYQVSDGYYQSDVSLVELEVRLPILPTVDNKPTLSKPAADKPVFKSDNKPNYNTDDNTDKKEQAPPLNWRLDDGSNEKEHRPETEQDLLSDAGLPELEIWSAENADDRVKFLKAADIVNPLLKTDLNGFEDLFANIDFWDELDSQNKQAQQEYDRDQLTSKAIAASGVTITAGYVNWLLRGGTLLTSMLSTLPGWKGVDPLPILSDKRKKQPIKDQESEPNDSAEALFE